MRLRLCAVRGKENPAETGCGKGAWAGGGHTPFITRASRAAGRTDGEAGGQRELSRGRRSGAGPPTATTRRADLRPREADADGFPCSRNGPPGLRVQKRLCSATCVETASSARSARGRGARADSRLGRRRVPGTPFLPGASWRHISPALATPLCSRTPLRAASTRRRTRGRVSPKAPTAPRADSTLLPGHRCPSPSFPW